MDNKIYDYPKKHPHNCDNCKTQKTIETDWDNDGHQYTTIVCHGGKLYVSYENRKREFIDEVGCPLFEGG